MASDHPRRTNIQITRVKPNLDLAISRFDAFSRMTRKLAEARWELKNRKLIDRAKGHNHKETLAGACAAAKQMPPLRGQVKCPPAMDWRP